MTSLSVSWFLCGFALNFAVFRRFLRRYYRVFITSRCDVAARRLGTPPCSADLSYFASSAAGVVWTVPALSPTVVVVVIVARSLARPHTGVVGLAVAPVGVTEQVIATVNKRCHVFHQLMR